MSMFSLSLNKPNTVDAIWLPTFDIWLLSYDMNKKNLLAKAISQGEAAGVKGQTLHLIMVFYLHSRSLKI